MVVQRKPVPSIGWPLLPIPDEQGRLNYPSLEQSVRQNIQAILRTRPGEQLMRPTFGAGLENMLHESNTLTTRRRIQDLVTESLKRWENRIELDRVDVTEVVDEPGHVRIEISYRIRRTGVANRVGTTMKLEG